MKCFEWLVKTFITSPLPDSGDTLQFAYRPNRSTDDAIARTLHSTVSHLDQRNTYVRMLFIDYSSALNTIVPSKLDMHQSILTGCFTAWYGSCTATNCKWWKLHSTSPGRCCHPWRTSTPSGVGRRPAGSLKPSPPQSQTFLPAAVRQMVPQHPVPHHQAQGQLHPSAIGS